MTALLVSVNFVYRARYLLKSGGKKAWKGFFKVKASFFLIRSKLTVSETSSLQIIFMLWQADTFRVLIKTKKLVLAFV